MKNKKQVREGGRKIKFRKKQKLVMLEIEIMHKSKMSFYENSFKIGLLKIMFQVIQRKELRENPKIQHYK